MTHDELLEKVNQGELGWFYGWMQEALLAVVELHSPLKVKDTPHLTYCESCQEMYMGTYPCVTIEAIEKALE